MATLPLADGTAGSLNGAATTNAQQKTNFVNLRTFLSDLLGTDSGNKLTARTVLGVTAAIQGQTDTAFTTAGTSTAFTLTPTTAITAYTTNQRFNVTFHTSSGASPTINISGLGTKSLKQYNSTGTKVNATVYANQISDIIYDGTDFVVIDITPPIATRYIANVRQTVTSGAVDASGYANILSVGTGLVPTLLATTTPVNIAFAAGFDTIGSLDYVGVLSANSNFPTCVGSQTVSSATNAISCVITTAAAHGLSVGSLVTLSGFTPTGYNGTYQIAAVGSSTTFTITLAAAPGATTVIGSYTVANFLFVDRNTSTGALTLGATILPPNYQYTTASTTSGQHTFVIPSMAMYVGNGSTASAVQRVFVGEANASSAAISSVVSYAFNGLYHIPLTAAPTAGTRAVFNHNLGVKHIHLTYFKECTTAGDGYSVGDRFYVMGDGNFGSATNWYGQAPSTDYKTISIVSGSTGSNFVVNKTTGVPVAAPTSAWSIGGTVQRGF